MKEVNHAVGCFYSLLHIFSLRYVILLQGEPVQHTYIVDRLLAEFAAAAVNFAKSIAYSNSEAIDNDRVATGLSSSVFEDGIETILRASHPQLFSYYASCLDSGKKEFLKPGLKIRIVPRSEAILSILPMTTMGEVLELPSGKIYETFPVPTPASSALSNQQDGLGGSGSTEDEEPPTKKRKR